MNPETTAFAWYGAFELKRSYRKNLAWAVFLATAFHLTLFSGFLFYQWFQSRGEDLDNTKIVVIKSISDFAPPPSMTASKPQVNVTEPNIAPPTIGIPTPVPDEEVVEEVKFATRAELAELSAPIVSGGSGDGDSFVVAVSLDEYFPAPGEFVAVEENPVIIKEVKPDYPEMARLTNRETSVWIEALVDQEGKVREVRVVKSSGSNVGFDEAAVEAAYKNVYKPAIQNGKPVAVRITYRVNFKLDK